MPIESGKIRLYIEISLCSTCLTLQSTIQLITVGFQTVTRSPPEGNSWILNIPENRTYVYFEGKICIPGSDDDLVCDPGNGIVTVPCSGYYSLFRYPVFTWCTMRSAFWMSSAGISVTPISIRIFNWSDNSCASIFILPFVYWTRSRTYL